MSDGVQWEVSIPYPPMPKKRPRVTSNGTYMPKEYREWKENIATILATTPQVKTLQGPVFLVLRFFKNRIGIIAGQSGMERFGQADIDNLIGGIMDAMQDGGCYADDRQVVAVQAQFVKEEQWETK